VIQNERIKRLNGADVRRGRYVLYWMQQAQRADCNHALEYAIRRANELAVPLLAVFGITQRFPEANERHYRFMLEGLRETRDALAERGILLVVRREPPRDAALGLASDAALLITDRGYLKLQKKWRRDVARRAPCRVVQVESDVVVPVEATSDKEEYAARTIRPKIHAQLDRYLVPPEQTRLERDSLDAEQEGVELDELTELLGGLRINRDAAPVTRFRGGTSEARRLLDRFIGTKLSHYAEGRNDPAEDYVSHMSPYLHFGQVSPLYVALRVRAAKGAGKANREAYLEELIVRRELSMNFCHYNADYDRFAALPDWAIETLGDHAHDARPHSYSASELERARTHDPYWNAAQREMVLTGKMHNYMRMYWGKKILEWSPTPQGAFRTALRLNNRYELDGRDPNSFAGVAWCFGKHDRAWGERDVLGKVRYMSAAGLERKFDMEAYLAKVEDHRQH
jgi:deoxyribodipyrimidine photo-lyase